MKRGLIAILAVFLLLIACSPVKSVQVEQTKGNEVQQPEVPATSASLVSKFKLIQDSAIRNPPTVHGRVKNVGNATGSVKVTARVYYAKVVSSEASQTLDSIAPDGEANFSITIDKTAQWTSYKVFLENS